MKKRLLFGALLMGSFLTANAQDDCAGAIDVSAGGEFASPEIEGEYSPACFGEGQTNTNPPGPLMANWYKYTPTANGLLTVSSVLESNPSGTTGTDTRVSIFAGTCDELICYNGNDDVDVAGNDFRSEITVPVEADVTYYIAWDNLWKAEGFDFSITFEETDCLSPNDLSVLGFSDATLDSATFAWEAAIGAPGAYDVQVGEIGFTPGEGTMFETNTTSVSLTDLSSEDNAGLDVYVRSDCGDSQGNWVGPFRLLLVAELPYSNNFDNLDGRGDGFSSTTWGISTNAEQGANIAESGDGFIFTNTSTTTPSDSWLFSRPISVDAGTEVTVTFQAWVASAGAVEAMLDVTFGDSTDPEDHTVAESFEIESSDDYEEFTASWTATEAGTYFIGFHHNSEATDAAASLVLDTIEVTGGAAGTEDVLASKFTVYPNPANNVINIANAENILVNGVVITDLNGRTVKNVSYDGVTEAQINVSDLAAGMYMMTVSSDKGTMTKKIVKN